jgi:hypothetical protein
MSDTKDVSEALIEIDEEEPKPQPPDERDGKRSPLKILALLLAGFFAVGVGALSVGGLVVWGVLNYLDTPERALAKLTEALDEADLDEARRHVSPSAWPVEHGAAPEMLHELLQRSALSGDEIDWTTIDDDEATVRWSRPTAIPEIKHEEFVELSHASGDWKVSRFQSGWDDSASQIFTMLNKMRAAADRRDAEQFLQHAEPGENTCTAQTCPIIIKAIEDDTPHLFIETIDMTGMLDGSFRVVDAGDTVTFRWLRKTNYLDQVGVVQLQAEKNNGQWKVKTIDARHFAEIDDEMDVWTENHSEMLWRTELIELVEVGSRKSFCDEYNWYGQCVTTVHPTFVHNIGERKIKKIKVSKNRFGRRFGDSTQTLWGVYVNIQPGKTVDNPSQWSPPVYRKPNSKQSFNFFRVDWVEFEDGERMSYTAKDYREEVGVGLTFDLVLETRTAAGSSFEDFEALQGQIHEDYGYSPDEISRLLGDFNKTEELVTAPPL